MIPTGGRLSFFRLPRVQEITSAVNDRNDLYRVRVDAVDDQVVTTDELPMLRMNILRNSTNLRMMAQCLLHIENIPCQPLAQAFFSVFVECFDLLQVL